MQNRIFQRKTAYGRQSWKAEFAELNGWEAETEAGKLLQGLGIDTGTSCMQTVARLSDREKVKVLLAQALFGNPDIILLDEPTNHLDVDFRSLAGGAF